MYTGKNQNDVLSHKIHAGTNIAKTKKSSTREDFLIMWVSDNKTRSLQSRLLARFRPRLAAVAAPSGSSPCLYLITKKISHKGRFFDYVGQPGLEPGTPCLKGRCSNRLSY